MLVRDLHLSVRRLLRTPGFTVISVLTLGVGIGMSVAVWSVIDAVLIEPLPYPDADRLAEILDTDPAHGQAGHPMSALNYLDYAERNRSFEAMAAMFPENLNLTGGDSPERVPGAWVSAQFFDVMGVPPQLGRAFRAEDDEPGRDLVAVISHGLWQRRYAAAENILGSAVVVNGRSHTIIGVAPAGFNFPGDTDLWLPIAIDPGAEDRNEGRVVGVGRFRSDVGIDGARADLESVNEWLRREYPDANQELGVGIYPLKETMIGAVRPSLLVLLAAVACVLLIASANVTILLSVRTAARQRELAVRHALGAGRRQMVGIVVAESVVLALAGGAVGLVLAHWGTRMLGLRLAEFVPRAADLGFDARVLGFAILLSVTVGLLAGVLPAIRLREDRIMLRLRETDRSVAGGSSTLGTAMVVAEIALSVVLLTAAILLIRTFVNLLHVDPGFDSDRVMTAEVALSDERYAQESSRVEFYRRAVEAIDAIPEVDAAGTVYPLPLFGRRVTTYAAVEGAPIPERSTLGPLVDLRFVSPGYLEAAGVDLAAGRFIDDSDTADSPSVAVVNESFVRRHCPSGEVVGRRTTSAEPTDPEAEWRTIVGVVRDVRHRNLADDAGPEMYVPVAQFPFHWATFVVRARAGTAGDLANPIRAAIHRIDPELAVFNVQPMTAVVDRSLGRTRIVTALLVLFASVGLALTGVGVFSVVSYSVGRRLHEVAVRMAVGGTPGRVVALIVKQGLVPVASGLILGAATALIVMRVLTSRLFGVVAHDPLTLSGTALLVLGISAFATWLPARRATQIDPALVLRSE